uniref:Mitochondrial genome maintenance exonuclease 1 n=1 Tax=Oryctolagus cuniculus TaxID=9986 RepID=A0A5F9CJV2_RABIT
MKAFQAVCRQLRPSKGFPGEPAPRMNFFTSSYCFGRKKKMNPYEEVDQGKYSDLVRSVLSCRGSAQTPESLFEEDALLYGPVSKRHPPKQDKEAKVPRNWFPIFNPERDVRPDASDPSVPLKIPLQKKVIPSVTRILQHTMTPQQVFYLERWKQRMVLELGEDGFAEYTSSSVWLDCGGLQGRIPCPPTFHGCRTLCPVLGQVAASTRRIHRKEEPECSEARLGAGGRAPFGNIQHIPVVPEDTLLFTVI